MTMVILLMIKMEGDHDLSYDRTPTDIFIYIPIDNIDISQLNADEIITIGGGWHDYMRHVALNNDAVRSKTIIKHV